MKNFKLFNLGFAGYGRMVRRCCLILPAWSSSSVCNNDFLFICDCYYSNNLHMDL